MSEASIDAPVDPHWRRRTRAPHPPLRPSGTGRAAHDRRVGHGARACVSLGVRGGARRPAACRGHHSGRFWREPGGGRVAPTPGAGPVTDAEPLVRVPRRPKGSWCCSWSSYCCSSRSTVVWTAVTQSSRRVREPPGPGRVSDDASAPHAGSGSVIASWCCRSCGWSPRPRSWSSRFSSATRASISCPFALAYLVVTGAVELMRARAPDRVAALLSGTVRRRRPGRCARDRNDGRLREPVALPRVPRGHGGDGPRLVPHGDQARGLVRAPVAARARGCGSRSREYQAAVSNRVALVTAATFLLFAFAAAIFSSVNERALRHSRAQLETLVQLGTELERAHRFDEVMEALVHHSCSRLGFARRPCSCGAVTGGTASSTTVRWSRCWRRRTDPRHSCGRHGSAARRSWSVRSTTTSSTRCSPARANVDRRAGHRRRRSGRCRGRRVGRWRRCEHACLDGAGVRAVVDAHRARAAQRGAARRGRAARDSATGSPGSPTDGCSKSRCSGRRRARPAGHAAEPAHPRRRPLQADQRHLRAPPATRCSGTSAPRWPAAPRPSTSRRATAATSSSCCCPAATRSTPAASPTVCAPSIAHRVCDAPVTVSVGVATMPDNAADAERLVAAADGALYEAKRSGRDRIHAPTCTADGAVAERVQWRTPLATPAHSHRVPQSPLRRFRSASAQPR